MKNIETEVRFLEIDTHNIINKLTALGATDCGRQFLTEVIIQEPTGQWVANHRRLRVRQQGNDCKLTYKEGSGAGMHMVEHEINVSDYQQTVDLLLATGLTISRSQEKYRHSFTIGNCTVDIDDWPGIPTYLEIEGPTVSDLQTCAELLGLDWSTRYEQDAMMLIHENYGLDLRSVTEFTFDKFPTQLQNITT